MNAEKARNISKAFFKEEIEIPEKIFKKIEKAALKGKFEITLFSMNKSYDDKLRELGFYVGRYRDQLNNSTVTIRWDVNPYPKPPSGLRSNVQGAEVEKIQETLKNLEEMKLESSRTSLPKGLGWQ